MSCASYNEDQLCLIRLACTVGIGPATIRRLRAAARRRGSSLRDMLRLDPAQWVQDHRVGAKVVPLLQAIEAPVLEGEAIADLLRRAGARVVLEGSPEYPPKLARHLGQAAPAVLFLLGEGQVLEGPCVAIVGSRAPSKAARAAAQSLAGALAAAGTTVVSGGAAGIDSAAHRGALASGATAVVPPVGITRFRWRGIRPAVLEQGRWCVLGQFPPHDGWRAGNALMRNRTIVALSDAVVGFEPRDRGGTWHSCLTALEMRKPLFVAGARPGGPHGRGIARLVRLGARRLPVSRAPDAGEFARLVREYRPPPEPSQLPLFGRRGGET